MRLAFSSPYLRRALFPNKQVISTASSLTCQRSISITGITAYQVDLPLKESSYNWSGGNTISTFDATVVAITTDQEGITGYGECTPLGPSYLPAYAEGVRAGIAALAPSLIGHNPTYINHINNVMDKAMRGHPYVKSALDMACWDILGKVSGLPVCELLGGRFVRAPQSAISAIIAGEVNTKAAVTVSAEEDAGYRLYRAISQDAPEKMAENVQKYLDQGYRIFQLKVGGNPQLDIARIRAVRAILDKKTLELQNSTEPELMTIPLLCDANTGWKMHQAMQVVNGVKDLNVYIEQPCMTYEECLSVRQHCPLPMVLDESVDDIGVLARSISDRAADVINLKISKVGGLTKARAVRDLAVSAGIPMNIEDTWGGDIVTAAIAHLAHSTHPDMLFCSTDFNSYGSVTIAKTTAHRVNGRMKAPTAPGLGVEPDFKVLGSPFLDIK